MKIFALLLLPGFALLLLAAHFYRAGSWWLATAALALSALLAVPRAWAARVIQTALVAGSIEWLRTLAMFAAERIAEGRPYLRLAAILVAVAVFTAGAALVFRTYRLRVRYGLGGRI